MWFGPPSRLPRQSLTPDRQPDVVAVAIAAMAMATEVATALQMKAKATIVKPFLL
jgi:hypothetical protein